MSSTYSTSLRIELQGTGENSGTWGTITNNNFSQSLEFSIAGVVDVACGDNAVTTLTNADGPQSQANNQARNAHIRLTGAHGAVRIAQFPATQKIYLITNATTDSGSSGPYAMTVRLGASGNTLSIANGATRLVATDGTNWYEIQTQGSDWLTKTGTYTAFAGDKIFADTSSGAFTITLPATASVGDEVRFLDLANNFDTHNLTVGRNSHKIDGQTSDLTVATEGAAFALVYSGATYGWKLLEK